MFNYSAKVSLIVPTAKAPKSITAPASRNILACELPRSGNKPKLSRDATICGKQIEPLNNPK